MKALDFKGMPYLLDHMTGRTWNIRTRTKKAIFGQQIYTGKCLSKGVPGINDHVVLKINNILPLSYGCTEALDPTQRIFILRP